MERITDTEIAAKQKWLVPTSVAEGCETADQVASALWLLQTNQLLRTVASSQVCMYYH